MESLRVGGLVSGLDTNTIITELMANAQAPIKRLNTQVSLLNFEKGIYNKVLSGMNDMKSALLPLKMEGTFKSKLATSSKDSVATAVANINTPAGTYNLNISQLAKPSYLVTSFSKSYLESKGAGVNTITSTLPPSANSGEKHVGTITKSNHPKTNVEIYKASDIYTDGKEYNKITSGNMMTNDLFDVYGDTGAGFSGREYTFNYTYDGVAKTATVKVDPKDLSPVNYVAKELETKINAAVRSDDPSNPVKVKMEFNDTTGEFSFAFYTEKNSKLVIDSFTDTAGVDFFGLETLSAPTVTTEIRNDMVAKVDTTQNIIPTTNAQTIDGKLNAANSPLIDGIKLNFGAYGATTGQFIIGKDSTVNSQQATKSTFYGHKLNTRGMSDADVLERLNMRSLANLNFADSGAGIGHGKQGTVETNGFFHINGVKIEIDDYTKYSTNDILAKINSSGAGVTATFDFSTKAFKIENNTKGGGDVTIGKDGDTSDFLSLIQITIPSGATYMRGQTAGTVTTSSKVNESGMPSVGSGIVSINGTSIYIDASNDTVDDIMGKVNKSGAGVTMTYDSYTDKFTLTSKTQEKITLGSANDTSNFFVSAGMTNSQKESLALGSEGQDAKFTVNGTEYTREKNQFNDVIAGIEFNLVSTGETSINVKTDTDKGIDALAEFISKYNAMINLMNPIEPSKDDKAKYAEPLTDDAKKDMSEKEVKEYEDNFLRVKTWQTFSKSSELKQLKRTLRSEVMNNVSSSVSGTFKNLTSLGIKIAGAGTEDVQLSSLGFLVDATESKDDLKKMLSENYNLKDNLSNKSDEVFKFFGESKEKLGTDGKPLKVNGITIYESEGWAKKYDSLIVRNSNSTSSIFKKAGTGGVIDSNISRLQKQIETQTLRAEAYLERTWAEFSAMEQRMQQIQSQSGYLSQIQAPK